MCICQFVNDRFIRNFNKFRSYVALKTRWGKSDTLDCHMGVTWFDAARWLAGSRRLIIFLLKYCDMSCNHCLIFRPNMEINCIEYFLYPFFFWVWRPFLCKAAPWQRATSCGRNTVHNTGLSHVIARPTHRPTSYDVLLSGHISTKRSHPEESLTNKTCTGSLLVHFFILEIFDHWWLTNLMDMNGEIVDLLSAGCLQHYVDRTSMTCGKSH